MTYFSSEETFLIHNENAHTKTLIIGLILQTNQIPLICFDRERRVNVFWVSLMFPSTLSYIEGKKKNDLI